ncbi:MAG TPA: ATP-binding protein [Acidobacteriota bacterium]|nr:ATP-binding protein [Acidobacteriota bacterium]
MAAQVRFARQEASRLTEDLAHRSGDLALKEAEVTALHDQLLIMRAQLEAQSALYAASLEHIKNLELVLTESRHQSFLAEQKAMEAAQSKNLFLANMSHELRTPLNAILGFLQLLDRDATLTANQRKYLSTMERSGENLLGLINDILAIAKLESGQVPLQETTFNLQTLLLTLEEMFRIRATETRVGLIFELDPELPRWVWGDEGKLRQILMNVVGNAFKFTEAGQIAVRARWQDGQVVFEIEDTGSGIDQQEINQLFQPFTQTTSGRELKEGLGLGLLICRNYVRLMGGDISITSRRGQGTRVCFQVRLLVAMGTSLQLPERRVVALEPDQPRYRILVVDDKWEDRTLLARLLTLVGFDVQEAGSGEAAVSCWRDWSPHLIWMDLVMPGTDGFSATQIIRHTEFALLNDRTQPLRFRTTIIGISANSAESDRKAAFDSGCDDFVAKPFREDTIFEKMIGYLGVRYVYENQPVDFEFPETWEEVDVQKALRQISLIDTELLDQLRQAAIDGDIANAQTACNLIAGQNTVLGTHLKDMVRLFQFDEILAILGGEDNPLAG